MSLLELREDGLWCPAGGFAIDPSAPVERAVVTHAHGDHLNALHREIVCSTATAALAKDRTRKGMRFVPLAYGEPLRLGAVTVSLHPAGHMLGSAMVRLEHAGEVTLVTGDFKRGADPTCEPCAVQRCDTLVCEATFAAPGFAWPDPNAVVAAIAEWVRECGHKKRAALLLTYALGKSQRVLALLGDRLAAPAFAHRSIRGWNAHYAALGVALSATEPIPNGGSPRRFQGRLCLVPPQALTAGLRSRFGACEVAIASGWALDAARVAQSGAERAFCLSDHADWNELLATVVESGARRVRFVHGVADALVHELSARGQDAATLALTPRSR